MQWLSHPRTAPCGSSAQWQRNPDLHEHSAARVSTVMEGFVSDLHIKLVIAAQSNPQRLLNPAKDPCLKLMVAPTTTYS